MRAKLCHALGQESGPGLCETSQEPGRIAELAIELGESRMLLRPGQDGLSAEGAKQAMAIACASYSRVIIALPSPSRWIHPDAWAGALSEVLIALPQGCVSQSEIADVINQLRQLGITVRGTVVTNYSHVRDPLGAEELAHLALPPPGSA